MKKELIDFMMSLWDRGLLTKSPEEFDYEWVVWDYIKSINSDAMNESPDVNEHEQAKEVCKMGFNPAQCVKETYIENGCKGCRNYKQTD